VDGLKHLADNNGQNKRVFAAPLNGVNLQKKIPYKRRHFGRLNLTVEHFVIASR